MQSSLHRRQRNVAWQESADVPRKRQDAAPRKKQDCVPRKKQEDLQRRKRQDAVRKKRHSLLQSATDVPSLQDTSRQAISCRASTTKLKTICSLIRESRSEPVGAKKPTSTVEHRLQELTLRVRHFTCGSH